MSCEPIQLSKFLASAVVKDREVAPELDIPAVALRFGAVKLQVILLRPIPSQQEWYDLFLARSGLNQALSSVPLDIC